MVTKKVIRNSDSGHISKLDATEIFERLVKVHEKEELCSQNFWPEYLKAHNCHLLWASVLKQKIISIYLNSDILYL